MFQPKPLVGRAPVTPFAKPMTPPIAQAPKPGMMKTETRPAPQVAQAPSTPAAQQQVVAALTNLLSPTQGRIIKSPSAEPQAGGFGLNPFVANLQRRQVTTF